MSQIRRVVVLLGIVLLPYFAFSQKNEISVSAGAAFASDQTATIGDPSACSIAVPHCVFHLLTTSPKQLGIEGTVAHRVFGIDAASIYLELPVMVVPNRKINAKSTDVFAFVDSTVNGLAVFFTPSLKLKFLASQPIAPWVSVGGGLAHVTVNNGAFVTVTSDSSRNSAALQVGGGLDFKTPIHVLGFRAEFRDFWAGSPITARQFFAVDRERQHNLFAAIGLVLKF